MSETKIMYVDWDEYERLRCDFETELIKMNIGYTQIRNIIGKMTKEHNTVWADNISRIITNTICNLDVPEKLIVIRNILFDKSGNGEDSEMFRMADFSIKK